MSTHNIVFYEDLTKIIFELSSNIIKYAPYFFCSFSFCEISILFIDAAMFDPCLIAAYSIWKSLKYE